MVNEGGYLAVRVLGVNQNGRLEGLSKGRALAAHDTPWACFSINVNCDLFNFILLRCRSLAYLLVSYVRVCA